MLAVILSVFCSAEPSTLGACNRKTNEIDVIDCIFDNLTDGSSGGAIRVNSGFGSVSITLCMFRACWSTSGNGGACYIGDRSSSVVNCCGEGCLANNGSFLYHESQTNITLTSILNCAPMASQSSSQHGSIRFRATRTESPLSYLNFTNDYIRFNGAAIYVNSTVKLGSYDIHHCTVVGCNGQTTIYSGLPMENGQAATALPLARIRYSNFVNNTASVSVLYGQIFGITVTNCSFRGPSNPTLFSGVFSFSQRWFQVENCLFPGAITGPVSWSNCVTNTQAATWSWCFWDTFFCPARCYSEPFIVSHVIAPSGRPLAISTVLTASAPLGRPLAISMVLTASAPFSPTSFGSSGSIDHSPEFTPSQVISPTFYALLSGGRAGEEQLNGEMFPVGLAVGLAAAVVVIAAVTVVILVWRQRQRMESSSESREQAPLDWTVEPTPSSADMTVVPGSEVTTLAGDIGLGTVSEESDGVDLAEQFL
jgi:hypothetical protein